MRRRPLLAAVALFGLVVSGGVVVAQAATSDPCDAVFTSNTIAKLKAYEACRFDRLDAALKVTPTIPVSGGKFTDNFASTSSYHIYKINL